MNNNNKDIRSAFNSKAITNNGHDNTNSQGMPRTPPRIASRLCRKRRGVGVVVAGAILVAIMFTTVAVYFMTVMQSDEVRAKAELAAMEYKNDKALESLDVKTHALLFRDDPASTYGEIRFNMNNTGPLPLVAAQMFVYDTTSGKTLPPEDVSGPLQAGGLTLNDGEKMDWRIIGYPAIEGRTYRLDIVTDRGNIVSANWPPPPEPLTPQQVRDLTREVATATVSQGLGSITLDFKSIGLILPNYKNSSGVDQTGWSVKMNQDQIGYPAFRVPQGSSDSSSVAYLMVRIKNVDPSGLDMTLMHDTGLIVSITNDQGQQQVRTLFICKADFASHQVYQYDEDDVNRNVVLKNAAYVTNDAGYWVSLVFCDTVKDIDTFANDFKPTTSATEMSPVFMVFRAQYEGTNQNYGQTIPYQAITLTSSAIQVGQPNSANIIACLKSNPNADCSNTNSDKYSETAANIIDGSYSLYVTLAGNGDSLHPVSAPFSVEWIYPDGHIVTLADESELQSKNVAYEISIPTTMSNLNVPIKGGHYIIQVTDDNDNVFYMTFKVEGSAGGNQAPIASDGIETVTQGQSITFDLVGIDPDSDPITFSITLNPTKGIVEMLNDVTGTVRYTADSDEIGQDSFDFIVTDSDGAASSVATVTITITDNNPPPGNNPPPAPTLTPPSPYSVKATGQGSTVLTFNANSVDPDGDSVTYSLAAAGALPNQQVPNGASIDPATGDFSWDPSGGQKDTWTFKVVATDSGGLSGEVTVTVTVT